MLEEHPPCRQLRRDSNDDLDVKSYGQEELGFVYYFLMERAHTSCGSRLNNYGSQGKKIPTPPSIRIKCLEVVLT